MKETEHDREVLALVPDGKWICYWHLPMMTRRRRYRLERLHQLGRLEKRSRYRDASFFPITEYRKKVIDR